MATIYALIDEHEQIRYIGSTVKGAEARMRKLLWDRKRRNNKALADFLEQGHPKVIELAEVPDEDRFHVEQFLSESYNARFPLLNERFGNAHTERSRRKISEGMQRYFQTRRAGALPTSR